MHAAPFVHFKSCVGKINHIFIMYKSVGVMNVVLNPFQLIEQGNERVSYPSNKCAQIP